MQGMRRKNLVSMSNFFEQAKAIPRGIETINEWLSEGGIPVDPATAQSRADTCLKCEFNQPGGVITELAALAIRRHLEVKSRLGMRVDGEKSLHTCQQCRCVLRLKVWCPQELVQRMLTPEEISSFPNYCWQTQNIEKP